MPIRVEIEGQGKVAEFADGTPQEVIDQVIQRDFFGKSPQTETHKEPMMSRGEQFMAGVGGGMVGLATGAKQLGSEALRMFVPKSREGFIDEYQKKLQAEEADRREVMDRLKAERGGPKGLANLGSWGEFVGETLPTAILPMGTVAKGAKAGQAAMSGLKAGGLGGALMPTVEGESRAANAAIGATAGAVLTPVANAAVKGTSNLVKRAGKGIETWIDETPMIGKAYNKAGEIPAGEKYKMVKELRVAAPPRPTDIKSAAARQKHWNNDTEAVLDTLKVVDDVPRSLDDAVEATNKAIQTYAGWADEIASATKSKVDLSDVIKELETVTSNAGYGEGRIMQAQRLLNGNPEAGIHGLKQLQAEGGYNVGAAIRRMAELNNDIGAYYKGQNVSGDAAEVSALMANKLRAALNKTADATVEGEEKAFTATRKALGRVLGLNERLLRQIEARDRNLAAGGQNVYDILAAQQLGQGLLTGNPAKVSQGFLSKGMGMVLSAGKSPDRAAKKLFERGFEITKGAKRGKPVIPPPKPAAPEMYNPEVMPKRWEGEMGIPGGTGKLGLEEGGIPPRPEGARMIDRTVQPDPKPAPYRPVDRTVQPDPAPPSNAGIPRTPISRNPQPEVQAQQFDVLSGGNIPAGPQTGIKTQGLPKIVENKAMDALDKMQRGKTEAVKDKNYKVLQDLARESGFDSADDMIQFLLSRQQ